MEFEVSLSRLYDPILVAIKSARLRRLVARLCRMLGGKPRLVQSQTVVDNRTLVSSKRPARNLCDLAAGDCLLLRRVDLGFCSSKVSSMDTTPESLTWLSRKPFDSNIDCCRF